MSSQQSVSARRLARWSSASLRHWGQIPAHARDMKKHVALPCGWGRLFFGQTFPEHGDLMRALAAEEPGQRDVAMYVHDHHVLLAQAPDVLFVDPSHTYRLWLHEYRPPRRPPVGFHVRLLQEPAEVEQMNRIYARVGMLQVPLDVVTRNQHTRTFSYFIAADNQDGAVIGTITGIDHREAFDDPDNGSSFWCLAADPDRRMRGVGRALVRAVAEHFKARGRDFVDLSVLYDNRAAIRLYKDLGFRRVPVYVVKRKNDFNRPLYQGRTQRLEVKP